MDTEQLKAIGINIQNIGEQIQKPDITASDLESLAKALHIAAETVKIVAEKSA